MKLSMLFVRRKCTEAEKQKGLRRIQNTAAKQKYFKKRNRTKPMSDKHIFTVNLFQ